MLSSAACRGCIPVDPVRYDQQRGLVHGLCRRRVLDQLDQPVAVDHLARRHGEVATRREGRQIDDAETAFLQVAQQVRRPIGEAGPRSPWPAQGVGIRHQQQRRAHGIDELAQVEVQALPLRLIHALDFAPFQQPIRGEQVQLLEGAVDRVVAPFPRSRTACRTGPAPFPWTGQCRPCPPALARLVPDVHGGARERLMYRSGPRPWPSRAFQGVQPDGAQRTSDLRPIGSGTTLRSGLAFQPPGRWSPGSGLGDGEVVELLHATGQQIVDEVVGRYLPPGFVGVDPVPGGAEISLDQGIDRPSIMSGRGGPEPASPLPCVPPADGTSVLSIAMTSPRIFVRHLPPVDSCRCAPSLVLDKLSWRCRRGCESGSDSDRPGCRSRLESPSTDSPDFLRRE